MIEVVIDGVEDYGLRVEMKAVPRIGDSMWINRDAYRIADVLWKMHINQMTNAVNLEDIVVVVSRVR